MESTFGHDRVIFQYDDVSGTKAKGVQTFLSETRTSQTTLEANGSQTEKMIRIYFVKVTDVKFMTQHLKL